MRLYCMGKSLVAAALMLLVERGRCALEDDVAKYIPAFGRARVAASLDSVGPSPEDRPVRAGLTLRRLLTHCSGLGYGKEFNLPPEGAAEESYAPIVSAVDSGEIRSLDAFCQALATRAPLRCDPGTRFDYSYGLDVLGRVVEVVSGRALDAFMREELFAPLGMVDTGFSVRREALPRLATLYGSRDTAVALGALSPNAPAAEPPWRLYALDGRRPEESAWAEGRSCPVLSGGGLVGHNWGGLVSSLNDVARFCLMLASGGVCPDGRRLFREATVEEMTGHDWLRLPACLGVPQDSTRGATGVTAKGPFGWNAMGELGVVEGAPLDGDAFELGEYGYGGIAETFWSVNPRRDLVVIWMTQQVDNHSWSSPKANLWAAARQAVAAVPAPRPSQPRCLWSAGAAAGKRRRLTRKSAVLVAG